MGHAVSRPARLADRLNGQGRLAGKVAIIIGRLDVLLNNAGFGGPQAALGDTDEALFDKILARRIGGRRIVSRQR